MEDVDVWTAWTDGAAIENPGAAGLGFVLVSPNGTRHEGYQGLGSATNNVAELTAILRVAELTPVTARVVIYTDSKYAIGVLQQNWKASKNIELIARTKSALRAHPSFLLEWVKGHSTNVENNVADKLSCQGAEAGLMGEPIVAIVGVVAQRIYGAFDAEPEKVAEVVGEEPKAELLLVLPESGKPKPKTKTKTKTATKLKTTTTKAKKS